MFAAAIPESVRRLIAESIDSIAELEALLLLREHPRAWTVEEVGARIYVSLPVATYTLGVLTARGFLVRQDGTYRYAPANSALEQAVAGLAAAYSSSLIAVTHLVHGKPTPSIQAFANAFRMRKDP
ncbi:MAG TPA: hypothetical protein VLB12_09430 [Gemmatimonadales bacterium]|nr:hypothetical protein [Gemmatimonadales bacterium]